MPELPWEKWFYSDWLSEEGLTLCEPSTRGIWADAVNRMMSANLPYIQGTTAQLSKLCRCSEVQMQAAICELKMLKIANITEQEGNTKITCRRMERSFKIKRLRSKAGTISATKRQQAYKHNVSTRSASASNISEYESSKSDDSEMRDVSHFENQTSGPVPKSNGDSGKWLKDDLDAMFKRNGRLWTYAEENALFMVTASPTANEEWSQIKRYHSKLVPKDKPFFPQSAISLLESWSKLLDKAAVYEVPKSPEELKRLQNMREMIR